VNTRQVLEMQADRIEAALTQHGARGRVTGGTVTPRWVRFQVLPAMGTKVSKVKGLAEEIAAALAAPSVRVSRRGATLAVEVPRDDPQPVRLLPLLRQLDGDVPPVTATLGLAEDGSPLLIRLPSPAVAPVLVAGMTGSGKTMLLQGMTLSLTLRHPSPRELALVLIDPRGGQAFDCFSGLPHLIRPVIFDAEEAVEMLASLVRSMEERDRREESTPPVVVFVDELADLLMTGDGAERHLTRLVQRGRGAGIHVVAATQKPTAAVVGSLVEANFPVRLVGKVSSADDARVASGWAGTGAERLLGRGDFLAVAEGRVTRFQAAHVSEAEIAEVLVRKGWNAPPRLQGGCKVVNDDQAQAQVQ